LALAPEIAFYRVIAIGMIEVAMVEEVNRHDYKEIESLLGH
jgi:hypothetical protein